MEFQMCEPAQGVDGKWYVAKDYSDRFSAYHLDFEREKGNLIEIEMVREICDESEIQNGDLVSFGSTKATIWRKVGTNA